jgi:hypothetical protein
MIVGQLDFSRLQRLAGANYQQRLDDLARRYI